MKKIAIHSVTDLITNSSTNIFTYSGGSEGALQSMINELFKVFGINKTCEEIFNTVVLCEDSEYYSEYISDLGEEYPEGIDENTDIEELYESVKAGKTPKPDWFVEAEESENSYHGYPPSTMLYLSPKSEEYEKLADLVSNFLYSTGHEVTIS